MVVAVWKALGALHGPLEAVRVGRGGTWLGGERACWCRGGGTVQGWVQEELGGRRQAGGRRRTGPFPPSRGWPCTPCCRRRWSGSGWTFCVTLRFRETGRIRRNIFEIRSPLQSSVNHIDIFVLSPFVLMRFNYQPAPAVGCIRSRRGVVKPLNWWPEPVLNCPLLQLRIPSVGRKTDLLGSHRLLRELLLLTLLLHIFWEGKL